MPEITNSGVMSSSNVLPEQFNCTKRCKHRHQQKNHFLILFDQYNTNCTQFGNHQTHQQFSTNIAGLFNVIHALRCTVQ